MPLSRSFEARYRERTTFTSHLDWLNMETMALPISHVDNGNHFYTLYEGWTSPLMEVREPDCGISKPVSKYYLAVGKCRLLNSSTISRAAFTMSTAPGESE